MDVLCVLTVMLILVNARNKNCFRLNVFCDIPSYHTIEHKVNTKQNISWGQLLHDRNTWPSQQPCKEAPKAKAMYLYKNKKKTPLDLKKNKQNVTN